MRLIDADAFGNRMYHEVFEKDSEDQRWDSGCWMRYKLFEKVLKEQPTVDATKIIRCEKCKHWKDSDGVYRRGFGAESKCPINSKSVFDGTFYCGMAERRQDVQNKT